MGGNQSEHYKTTTKLRFTQWWTTAPKINFENPIFVFGRGSFPTGTVHLISGKGLGYRRGYFSRFALQNIEKSFDPRTQAKQFACSRAHSLCSCARGGKVFHYMDGTAFTREYKCSLTYGTRFAPFHILKLFDPRHIS